MKFDSNQAWREASAAILANRDVLLALAGVFFLLPRLAMALFLPSPPPTTGNDPVAMAAAMEKFYSQLLPYLVPILLFQGVGTLAILTLFTDRTRPTVAQAIQLGAKGLLPYIGAQILFVLGAIVTGGTIVGLAGLTHSPALTNAVAIAVIAALIAAYVHLILTAPVIAVERLYSPLAALRRSWQITRGHALRVGLFLLLLALVAFVGTVAITAVTGAAAALIGGADAARITNGFVSGLLGALITLITASVLAAIHRQLAARF